MTDQTPARPASTCPPDPRKAPPVPEIRMIPVDLIDLRRLAEAATPGPWFWWGNTDTHSVALCGHQPGLGVCEVISTLGVDRSTTGREADQLRRDLAEYASMDAEGIADAVREWAFDEYDQPRIDQRLCVTDENHIRRTTEELAVYEVARAQGLPDDTPRDHERIYRADVCDLRATNARYLAAANPAHILALLDERDALAARLAASEVIAQAARQYVEARQHIDLRVGSRDETADYLNEALALRALVAAVNGDDCAKEAGWGR